MSLSDMLFSPLKRFYTFVLKKLIGEYLKDELRQSQLEVKLGTGILELSDVELDVEVLNEAIPSLPFEVVAASVTLIRAEIPWHSLATKNCKITLKGLEVEVKPLDDCEPSQMTESFLMEASRAALEEENVSSLVKQHLKRRVTESSSHRDNSPPKSTKGMTVIGNKLKNVLQKTEFFVEDCSVVLNHMSSDSKARSSAVVFRVSRAAYTNDTSLCSNPEDPQFRKEIKFRGLRVGLIADRDDEGKRREITVAHAEIEQWCVLYITPPPVAMPSEAKSKRIEIQGNLHAVRVLVGPSQVKQVLSAIADMTNSSRLLMKKLKAMQDLEEDDCEPNVQNSTWEVKHPTKSDNLDDLFKKTTSQPRFEPQNPTLGRPVGRPIRAEEYKTVENLLQRYQPPTHSGVADSFVSTISHATDGSDQFYDCQSGYLRNPASSDCKDPQPPQRTPENTSSKSGLGWNLAVKMERVSIILLERDVDAMHWPSDIDWYLSPIPTTLELHKHPASGILSLGVNHFVGHLEGISTYIDQNPSQLRANVSVMTISVLEYCRCETASAASGNSLRSSSGTFRWAQLLQFDNKQSSQTISSSFKPATPAYSTSGDSGKSQSEMKSQIPPSSPIVTENKTRGDASSIQPDAKHQEELVTPNGGVNTWGLNDVSLDEATISNRVLSGHQDDMSNFDDLIEVTLDERPRPTLSDDSTVGRHSTNRNEQKEDNALTLGMMQNLNLSAEKKKDSSLQQNLKRMERQLNPDMRISFVESRPQAGNKAISQAKLDLKMQEMLLTIDLETVRRLKRLFSTDSKQDQPVNTQDICPPQVGPLEGASEAASQIIHSPSSSDGDVGVEFEDYLREQVHDKGRYSTKPRVRTTVEVPRIYIRLDLPKPDGIQGADALFVDCERLLVCNAHDSKSNSEDCEHEEESCDDPWHLSAARTRVGQISDKKINRSVDSSLILIEECEISIMTRAASSSEDAIFHPFLAPNAKISAHETEAFFQRLWDPYRVWEQSEDTKRRAKTGGKKHAKTLWEFERSCQRQSASVVRLHGRSCLVSMTKTQFDTLRSSIVRVAETLSKNDEKEAVTDTKRSEKGRERFKDHGNPDPALLPEHPHHVPAPPRIPPIHVKVSRQRLHAAYHHGTAVSVTLKTFNMKILDTTAPLEGAGFRQGFELTVNGFRNFHVLNFNHENTNYTSLTMQDIELRAAKFGSSGRVRETIPILLKTMRKGSWKGGNSEKLFSDGRHIVQLVHVTSDSSAHSKQIQTAVNFNAASLHVSKIRRLEEYIGQLKSFFAPSTDPPSQARPSVRMTRKAASLYLHATNCAVDYNPANILPRGVLMFSRISMRMCDKGGPSPLHITVDLSDLRGYIIPNAQIRSHPGTSAKRNSTLRPQYLHRLSGDSLIAYLEANGFLRVASIDSFQVGIQILPKDHKEEMEDYLRSNPLVPDTMVELTRGGFIVDVCSDSFSVLSALASQVIIEFTPAEFPQEVEISLKNKGNLMGGIDLNAFEPKDTPQAPLSMKQQAILEAAEAYSKRSLADTKIQDYFNGNSSKSTLIQEESKKRRVKMESQGTWSEPVRVRENHFVFKGETDRIYKSKELHPPRSHPRPNLTFKMHSVTGRIRLYGGKDFEIQTAANGSGDKKVNRDAIANDQNIDSASTASVRSRVTTSFPLIRDDLRSAASSACNSVIFDSKRRGNEQANHLQTVSIRPLAREDSKGLHAHVRDTYMQRALEGDHYEDIGHEANGPARGNPSTTRQGYEKVEIKIMGVHMVFNAYKQDSRVASFLALTVDDVDVVDMVKGSEFHGSNLLAYDPPSRTLRESGSSMVRVKISNIRPDPERSPERQEARITAAMLPIRLMLDQDTVEFIVRFLKGISIQENERKHSLGVKSTHLPDENPTNPPETYIQSFKIDDCHLCIDYRPKRIDLDALRAGEYDQLAHLLRLEEVRIQLEAQVLRAIEGWGGVAGKLGKLWAEQIVRQQLHRCLAGVQPLRSLIRVGSGVVDLVVLPLEQFRRDGSVIRGLRKGVSAFINSITVETINVATSLAIGAQSLLESVDSVISTPQERPGNQAGKKRHYKPKSRSPGIVRTPRSRVNIDKQPIGLRDGLQQAYDAFSGGLKDAARQIVVVPADKLNAGEYKGAVSSAVTAMPSAVIRSMVGVSEGVSKVLIGAKNSAKPILGRETKLGSHSKE